MTSTLCAVTLAALCLVGCSSPEPPVSGIEAEIEAAKAVTPLPPGATFGPTGVDPDDYGEPGSGTQMIQFQAACSWFSYWIDGLAAGDSTRAEEASRMADEIVTWDTYRLSDPSFQNYLTDIIERARLGDPSGLVENNQLNC